MAVVVKMAGTSPELYSCIAPLVMNPEIIKYNHNYPFKTSESFVWFVAFSNEDNHVLGFFPVEIRKKSAIINNYYVEEDAKDVFLSLLEAVTNEFLTKGKELEAVVQKSHESYFRTQGFEIVRAWSLYLKMKKTYEEE